MAAGQSLGAVDVTEGQRPLAQPLAGEQLAQRLTERVRFGDADVNGGAIRQRALGPLCELRKFRNERRLERVFGTGAPEARGPGVSIIREVVNDKYRERLRPRAGARVTSISTRRERANITTREYSSFCDDVLKEVR